MWQSCQQAKKNCSGLTNPANNTKMIYIYQALQPRRSLYSLVAFFLERKKEKKRKRRSPRVKQASTKTSLGQKTSPYLFLQNQRRIHDPSNQEELLTKAKAKAQTPKLWSWVCSKLLAARNTTQGSGAFTLHIPKIQRPTAMGKCNMQISVFFTNAKMPKISKYIFYIHIYTR